MRFGVCLAFTVIVVGALNGCPSPPPPPECVADADCGFQSQICRDGKCVDADSTHHADCCTCLDKHGCLLENQTEAQCEQSLNEARPINADAACTKDDARCGTVCGFLSF